MQLAPWIRSGPPCSAGTPWFWRVDGIARRIGVFLLFRTCPIPTTLASSKISRITVGTVWNLCPILCKQCCSPSVILRIVVMKCKSPFPQPTHKGRHSVSWRCRKATHSSGVRWIRSPPSTTQSFRSSRNTVTYGLFWWISIRIVLSSIRRIPRSARITFAYSWVCQIMRFHC